LKRCDIALPWRTVLVWKTSRETGTNRDSPDTAQRQLIAAFLIAPAWEASQLRLKSWWRFSSSPL